MRRQVIALAVYVTLGVALSPTAVLAGGRPHPHRGHGVHQARPGHGGVSAVPEFKPKGAFGSPGGFPFAAADQRPGRFSHRLRHQTFLPSFTALSYAPAPFYEPSVSVPAPVVNVAPVIYVSPSVYVAPAVLPQEVAPVAAVVPAAPPIPSVVEHATGRYELRGDGVASPYAWVWIPNPPSAPPAAASPSPDRGPATDRTETYRWTDAEGTTFWTNRLERVPEAYRKQAQGLATGLPPR